MTALPPAELLERMRAGEIGALARIISIVENERPGFEPLLRGLYALPARSNAIGFTGPPGAGKSTLINAVIRCLRQRGKTVGIIAVDPSSPITGGAILGDRIRMGEHVKDDGVFARSLGSRGHLGGVSRATRRIVDLLRRSCLDVVIVETVGTGQSEVEIAKIADVKLVVNAPGLGDDIQAIKAGILEIADIMVVNKSDLPAAASTKRHLEMMLMLRTANRDVPVLATSPLRNEGIEALVDASESLLASRIPLDSASNRADIRSMIAEHVANAARRRLGLDGDPALAAQIDALCDAFAAGELGMNEITARALRLLA